MRMHPVQFVTLVQLLVLFFILLVFGLDVDFIQLFLDYFHLST